MDKAALQEIIRFDDNDDTIRPDHTDDAARSAEAIQFENAPNISVVPLPDFARLVPLKNPAKLAFHKSSLFLKTTPSGTPNRHLSCKVSC